MTINISINGQMRSTDASPNTKALFVLRNEFGQCDVRVGCSEGHCGACMVQVDGMPMTTCDMALWALEGKAVTTVQGLGTPENPHPVQAALLAEQAGQCGYCLSGIIATAAALVAQPGTPDEAQVRTALDRHLCRCGTHSRIIKAVMRAFSTRKEQA
jgi:nicotinate dehydrogenase subunit A